MRYSEVLEKNKVGKYQILLICAIFLVLMIDGLDLQLLSLLAPVIIEEWSVSRTEFGPALAAALFGMAIGSIVGGWIADRFGRLITLIGSMAVFGLATVLIGFVDNVASLAGLRVLAGLGFGAAAPAGMTLVSEWLPARSRNKVISLNAIGVPAGGMVGAIAIVYLEPAFGWAGSFVLIGAITLLLGAVLWGVLRESPAFLLSKGKVEQANSVAHFLLETEDYLIAETDDKASVSINRKQSVAIFDQKLAKLNFATGAGFFFGSLVAYAFIAWISVILTSTGYSNQQAYLSLMVFNLCAVFAGVSTGIIINRFGTKLVMALISAALFVLTVSLGAVLAWVDSGATSAFGLLAIFIGMSGAVSGASMASVYVLAAAGYPPSCRGQGLGFGLMIGRIGGISIAFFGGWILDVAEGDSWLFFLVIAISSIAYSGAAFVSDRHTGGRGSDEMR